MKENKKSKLNCFLQEKFYPVFKSAFIGLSILPITMLVFMTITYLLGGPEGILGENFKDTLKAGYMVTQVDLDGITKFSELIKEFLRVSFAISGGMALHAIFFVIKKSKKTI
jgi:hypothetical protein